MFPNRIHLHHYINLIINLFNYYYCIEFIHFLYSLYLLIQAFPLLLVLSLASKCIEEYISSENKKYTYEYINKFIGFFFHIFFFFFFFLQTTVLLFFSLFFLNIIKYKFTSSAYIDLGSGFQQAPFLKVFFGFSSCLHHHPLTFLNIHRHDIGTFDI